MRNGWGKLCSYKLYKTFNRSETIVKIRRFHQTEKRHKKLRFTDRTQNNIHRAMHPTESPLGVLSVKQWTRQQRCPLSDRHVWVPHVTNSHVRVPHVTNRHVRVPHVTSRHVELPWSEWTCQTVILIFSSRRAYCFFNKSTVYVAFITKMDTQSCNVFWLVVLVTGCNGVPDCPIKITQPNPHHERIWKKSRLYTVTSSVLTLT